MTEPLDHYLPHSQNALNPSAAVNVDPSSAAFCPKRGSGTRQRKRLEFLEQTTLHSSIALVATWRARFSFYRQKIAQKEQD
jgi:hypothetical protein